jgi:hypothetical protein
MREGKDDMWPVLEWGCRRVVASAGQRPMLGAIPSLGKPAGHSAVILRIL